MYWSLARIVLGLLLACAACGPSSPPVDDPASHEVHANATPDTPDRCPMLLGCYKRTPAMAKCSDPVLKFRPNSTELEADSKLLLGNLAAEIRHQAGLRTLLIEGHAAPGEASSLAEARANAIRVGLVDQGIDSGRLATNAEIVKGGSNDVNFVVVDCSRTDEAATRSKSPSYWLLLY